MLCFLLSDLAIVMRQTHQLYNNEKGKPYILAARMKGLLAKERSNKHISLNARPQLLTMISSGVASAFAGSLVIEYIFNIPGVGRLLLDSIRYGDRPVLIGIVLLLFLTSSLIFLLAAILYRYFDPRLKASDMKIAVKNSKNWAIAYMIFLLIVALIGPIFTSNAPLKVTIDDETIYPALRLYMHDSGLRSYPSEWRTIDWKKIENGKQNLISWDATYIDLTAINGCSSWQKRSFTWSGFVRKGCCCWVDCGH